MSASVSGVPQLRARIEAIKPNAGFMRVIGLSAVREQKLIAPRKTSNYARLIHLGRVTATFVETIASAAYSIFVERDTKAHEIRPRNRKSLRYAADAGSARLTGTPRSGGRVRFARRVQHPGTRGQHVMERGAKKAVEGAGLKATIIDRWNRAA